MAAFAADALVVVHLLFVAFVVLGGFLLVRWARLIWLHLPAAVWGAYIEFSGGICPLTPLENRLRVHGGESAYAGGFVEHYLLPVLYPASLDTALQNVLGGVVVAVNLVAYGLASSAWRRKTRGHPRG